jgi:hypothetical protein
MMKLYQTAVFTAIVCAGIYYEMDTEGLALYAVAAMVSYFLTVGPLKAHDLWMTWRENSQRRRFTRTD